MSLIDLADFLNQAMKDFFHLWGRLFPKVSKGYVPGKYYRKIFYPEEDRRKKMEWLDLPYDLIR